MRILKPRLHRSGFTLIELLVVMSIIALLLSILMPALGRARKEAVLIKDATRIRGIHSGWITWAAGHNGRYPTPGYVNREGDMKGRGAEDRLLNTTDNVHSLCVMENIYDVDRLICDSEPNPNVFVYSNYDYGARDIQDDTYWDENLNVDLQAGGEGGHVSYASIPLIGERKRKEWANSGSSEFPILANRGPMFGEWVDHSMTYEIHGEGKTWIGNVCWQDNHMSLEETFNPISSIYRTSEGHVQDNMFNIDCVSGFCHFWGADSWLVLVSELQPGGDLYEYQLQPTLEWDDE